MRLELFGVGTQSESRAITAQRRLNCVVERRQEMDRTAYVLRLRDGLASFTTSLGASPSRAMWAVNTLSTPLLFTVHAGTLYSINNAMVVTVIGVIGTIAGDVSMADDGTFLVLVDGVKGYVYNMTVPAGLNQIVDGNFTTSPKTVSWQDGYFIVTSGLTRQFQLSQITPTIDPMVWPAIQINFAASGPGAIQAGEVDHNILNLFTQHNAEFWQDTGSPDFPYALIPGSSAEFGLAAPWSLAKFDNSLVGVFQSEQGGVNVSRMAGFSLRKLSDHDIDSILSAYTAVGDAEGFAYTMGGHPMYVANFPTENASWAYDGLSNVWSEFQSSAGRYWGNKFANFVGRLLVSDYRNGNIYQLDEATFSDNGTDIAMEVQSKHIWNDDKFIGIKQVQIDIESGVGLVSGQGVNPVCDLQVSKDGGFSFQSMGYSSLGPIGNYTQRMKWYNLGAARDWVLKLRITDPIKRIITGASAEVQGAGF